ncbi:MAG TPA: PKD domain-containing protein [Chitinophagales bacterium]|nr:PKD domain-containing protein [Chitinophagales bacterium]
MKKALLFTLLIGVASLLKAQEYRLVWPKNNYVADTNYIVFQWSVVDGALTYDLQIDDDPQFGSPFLVALPTNATSQPYTLSYGLRYYWRVRVNTSQGAQAWSYAYEFDVFEPSQLAGLKLWYEASRNIDVNSAPGAGPVNTWTDRSGSILATTASSSTPALQENIVELKGKSILNFSGGVANPPYMTFSPSVGLDASASGSGYTFLSVRNYVTNPGTYLQYLLGGSGGESNGFISDASYYVGAAGWGAYTTVGGWNGIFATPASQLTGTYSIYTVQPDKLFRNCIQRPSGSTSVDGAKPNANSTFSLNAIGRHNSGAGPYLSFKGNLAEMILYDNKLDSANRYLAEQYLRFKYANPTNLGPDKIFPSFCVLDTLRAGPGYFTSYLWSTGATTASIIVTSVGKYWVEATDIFGFKTYDTINIRPQIFFNQLPATAQFCAGDSLVWNTGYPANGFTFAWSNGENTPAISIKNSGTYQVTITDNANSNCQLTSTGVSVVVDTFPNYTLGADTSFCAGNRLNFIYADSLQSILWSNGDTTRETVISTAGNYSVTAVNANGCVAEDEIYVSIKGIAPDVNFSNSIICATDTISFIDLTLPPNGVPLQSWVWDFGDGNTDTLPNTTHVYAGPGTYTVVLTVTTDSGCVNTLSKTLTGYLKPEANFISKVSCAEAETKFTDLSTTTLPAQVQLRKWYFGTLDSSILQDPVYSFNQQGKYLVTLRVTNTDGCVSIASDSIEVFAPFDADIEFDKLCFGDSVVFTDKTPSYSIVKWVWNTGDNYFNTNKTFKHKYTAPGNYPVSLQVENAIGCIDVVRDTVTVYPAPIAAFDDGITCVERLYTPVNRSTVTEQNNTWKWTIAGSNYAGIAPQHFFADTGLYGVSLLITSENGCKDTATGAVKVSPNPTADFVFSPLYGDAPLLATFTNQSRNASSYVWNFGDGVTDNAVNPTHTYTTNDTFDIKLVAINSAGCSDSAMKNIVAIITDLDISVDRVFVTKAPMNDGTVLVNVTADLSNQGTRLITNTRLYATIGSGGIMSEQLDTLIQPGAGFRYTFKAKFVVAVENASTYVCVEATSVNNGETETRLDNNDECTSLNDVIQIIGPTPNPARGSATLGIVLSRQGKVTVEIFNVLGQPVLDMTELDLPVGRSTYDLPVKLLRAGEYFIRIKNNDEKLIRKMIVH